MNINCVIFVATSLAKEDIEGKRVLEVGSLDVNGSLRPLIEFYRPREYVGVDIAPGRGVDILCDIQDLTTKFGPDSFDIIISTELIEHVQDWRTAIHNIKAVCKNGGRILITTRSLGFPYHGYPSDYWRYEPDDMKYIFQDYSIDRIEKDPALGIFIKATKPKRFVEKDLSGYELYSIVTDSRVSELRDKEINEFSYRLVGRRERIRRTGRRWMGVIKNAIRQVMRGAVSAVNWIRHHIASVMGRYYFEDDMRVSPERDDNNYKNHCKFYGFAAQFVKGKDVVDVGCGTGYGCKIFKSTGATIVSGSDISKKAIAYARSHYKECSDFIIQGITDLHRYKDDAFDVSICSEVLEHVKEYGKTRQAVAELKRITKPGGLIIIGTPNTELLADHGFDFTEIKDLITGNFSRSCIFENALIPFGAKKELWEERVAARQVGIVVSENIDLVETCVPPDVKPELKRGITPGRYEFEGYVIDTSLLHNTHSWVIVAVNDKLSK